MSKYLLIILSLFAINYAQTYCAGETVSISDQNAIHLVGAAYDDYEVGDDFKLADWSGDLNGGQYHVVFIDMSASW